MTYYTKFLVFFVLLQILLVSTEESNLTFLVSGGYRPQEHTLTKYIVSLRLTKFNQYSFGSNHYCGGSIINSLNILTAAHCLCYFGTKEVRNEKEIEVVAGSPNRVKKTHQTEVIEVESVFVHPNYDSVTYDNDIGLLLLKTNIHEDDSYVQEVELSDGPAKVGTKCTVVGWGTVFDAGPLAADALYADVIILKMQTCTDVYEDFEITGKLCIGYPDDLERDACRGDSGSPLICNGKLTAVVSYGSGCGEVPGLYTDIWYYLDWIYNDFDIEFKRSNGKNATSIKLLFVVLLTLFVWIVN